MTPIPPCPPLRSERLPCAARRLAAALAMLACMVLPARAEVYMSGLSSAPGSGINIELIGYYDNLPAGGMAPIRVVIRNDSGRTRQWTFHFYSEASHRLRRTVQYEWKAEVESGREQWFELLVPVGMVDTQNFSYPSLQVTVDGYGLLSNRASYSSSHSYSGNPHTACTGMSASLAVETQGPLKDELSSQGMELVMCTLSPQWLSDDWRAYQGFGSLWIADRDWEHMGDAQRGAVLRWVAQGGILHYAGRSMGPDALARAGLPPVGGGGTRHGAGVVHPVRWNGGPLEKEATARAIKSSYGASHAGMVLDRYPVHWNLTREVPERALRVGILIFSLLVFALAVGPLNLMVLAGRDRRHRLFVTTPVISLAASVLLVGLILLQDGIGGTGTRAAMLYLMPTDRQEWLVQEQLSRTGVLLSRDFALPQDVYMIQLLLGGSAGEQQKRLSRSPEVAGGDWFTSRSRQGQYLSVIRPSRSRVELLNADGVRDRGEAPVLLSTLDEPLTGVYYLDANGHYWRADRLRVGERTPLLSSTREEFRRAWSGERSRMLAQETLDAEGAAGRPHGFIFGVSTAPDSRLIETLPSIRWRDDTLIVIGPCVAAEAERG